MLAGRATNYGMRFITDGYCDHNVLCAESLVEILEAPGMFMLATGVTEEDLEAHDPAVEKIAAWLADEYAPF